MTRSVTIQITDAQYDEIDEIIASAANRGDDLGTISQLTRHALLTWLDFYTRLHRGELDNSSSARLLIRTLPAVHSVRREKEFA